MSAAQTLVSPLRPQATGPADRAVTASTLAFGSALGCAAMFLPPLFQQVSGSALKIVALALALATSLLLHWVFLGLAARRMGRSAVGWVAPALLLFPVGSAAALILLGFFAGEARTPAAPRPSSAA